MYLPTRKITDHFRTVSSQPAIKSTDYFIRDWSRRVQACPGEMRGTSIFSHLNSHRAASRVASPATAMFTSRATFRAGNPLDPRERNDTRAPRDRVRPAAHLTRDRSRVSAACTIGGLKCAQRGLHPSPSPRRPAPPLAARFSLSFCFSRHTSRVPSLRGPGCADHPSAASRFQGSWGSGFIAATGAASGGESRVLGSDPGRSRSARPIRIAEMSSNVLSEVCG